MKRRSVGLVGAIAIGVGGMVGGGIFAVLGVVAVQARGAAPLASEIGASRLITAAGVLGCLAAVVVLLQQTVRDDVTAVVVLAGLVALAGGIEALWLRSVRGECRPSATEAVAAERNAPK